MLDFGGKLASAIQAGCQGFEAALLLLLELAVVLSHEGFDFTRHGEQFFPLLLIESDWESSKSVYRHAAFLTDLDGRWPALLQCCVFGPQSLEFCLQILIAHRAPGVNVE
jgi:hypothetical protein